MSSTNPRDDNTGTRLRRSAAHYWEDIQEPASRPQFMDSARLASLVHRPGPSNPSLQLDLLNAAGTTGETDTGAPPQTHHSISNHVSGRVGDGTARERTPEENSNEIPRTTVPRRYGRSARRTSLDAQGSSSSTSSTIHVDEYAWDAAHSNDVTIHLELKVAIDLESELDEFCRLARLGRFKDAKAFYHSSLGEHKDNPYVFCQYAQFLLDMGDYAGVKGLVLPTPQDETDCRLVAHWKLVSLLAKSHVDGLYYSEFVDAMALAKSTACASYFGSTEARLRLAIPPFSNRSDASVLPPFLC